MPHKLLFICIFCAALACTSKKDLAKYSANTLSTEQIVSTLASDTFMGRKPGTNGMELATKFVEEYLSAQGIKPFFNNSYRDTFNAWGAECYNIVGLIESENIRAEHIVIGAHLDHLGVNNRYKPDSIFNGANDNASGVTAVLKIAEQLKQHNFNKHIIVVLFSAEELGLRGSEHLAQRLHADSVNIAYMINFEMIGKPLTSSPGNVYISGYDRSDFASVANELLDEEFVVYDKVDTDYGIFNMSDNYPFYTQYNIPAHTICTFDFKNFAYLHEVADQTNELDIAHMDAVIQKTTKLIVRMLENEAIIKLN